jgi:hypothetical protein
MTRTLTSARAAALLLALLAAACSKKNDMSRGNNGTTTDSAGASVGATTPSDSSRMSGTGATGTMAPSATAAGSTSATSPSTAATGTSGSTGGTALAVSQMSLGKHIGSNKQVTDTTSTFAPHDTIYLSVMTANAAPNSKLTARWSFGKGQVVKETSQTLANPSSAAATEFHLSKKSAWPTGTYMVEVLVNGQSAGTKNFTVQ